MTKIIFIFLVLFNIVKGELNAEQQWQNFKSLRSRAYESSEQEKHRYQVFRENLRIIEEHNAKYKAGLVTWYMEVNQFTDMTPEEFRTKILSNSCLMDRREENRVSSIKTPEDRSKYRMTPFKDYTKDFNPVREQGDSLTCYAFAETATVEAYLFRNGYPKVYLSPQNIVDCTRGCLYNNSGSHGGEVAMSMKYMMINGVMKEEDYPYTGFDNECNFDKNKVHAKIDSYTYVENTERDLIYVLDEYGPISISVDCKELPLYGGGVFTPSTDYNETNHEVVIVGYGQTKSDNMKYWTIRNSWGDIWGENGYMRVIRDINGQRHIGIGKKDSGSIAVIPFGARMVTPDPNI